MTLKLYNTLKRKKDSFRPLELKKVGMYSCGPTVYNYAHIGNLKTYIFNDLLSRSLTFLGYEVTHVMNITDVDDKTIKQSQKNKESLSNFTKKYEKVFFEDLTSLNIKRPTQVLRATENIPEMIEIIEDLLKKEIAYKSEDGIYFDIDQSENYGKLALLEKQKSSEQRISNDEYDKASKSDFALWKFYTKEDGDNKWDAPFGEGRPGWHIECSAMSMKILGHTFDIHTGGSDLIFPHHTNEIAQSEASTEKKFVKYWLHSGFLTMDKGKMSKSLGNILTIQDLNDKKFNPLAFRYMVLTAQYREQLNFSIPNLKSAQNAYKRLKNICSKLKDDNKKNSKTIAEFKKAIEDDLNLPKAIQAVWRLLRDEKAKGKYQTIEILDEVLGLKLLENENVKIPKEVRLLITERNKARKEEKWAKADKLRNKITKLGYQIDDTSKGTDVKEL